MKYYHSKKINNPIHQREREKKKDKKLETGYMTEPIADMNE